jgi:hypothetical protein
VPFDEQSLFVSTFLLDYVSLFVAVRPQEASIQSLEHLALVKGMLLIPLARGDCCVKLCLCLNINIDIINLFLKETRIILIIE